MCRGDIHAKTKGIKTRNKEEGRRREAEEVRERLSGTQLGQVDEQLLPAYGAAYGPHFTVNVRLPVNAQSGSYIPTPQ